MAEKTEKSEKASARTVGGKTISQETEQSIIQLQNTQRQLQSIAGQRQRFEFEVLQTDSALAELEKANGKTYKSVGTLLIEAPPKDLKEELNERRENMNARIDTLKKQEDRLRSKGEELQQNLEKEFGTEKSGSDSASTAA